MVRKKYGRIIASVLAAATVMGGGIFGRNYHFRFRGGGIKGAGIRGGWLQH